MQANPSGDLLRQPRHTVLCGLALAKPDKHKKASFMPLCCKAFMLFATACFAGMTVVSYTADTLLGKKNFLFFCSFWVRKSKNRCWMSAVRVTQAEFHLLRCRVQGGCWFRYNASWPHRLVSHSQLGRSAWLMSALEIMSNRKAVLIHFLPKTLPVTGWTDQRSEGK